MQPFPRGSLQKSFADRKISVFLASFLLHRLLHYSERLRSVLHAIERGRNSGTFDVVSVKVRTATSGMPVSSLSNDVLYSDRASPRLSEMVQFLGVCKKLCHTPTRL